MGCYCTKTKEIKESKLRNSETSLPQEEQITESPVYIKKDFEERPQKIVVISNTNKGNVYTPRVIGGKKEIFSQLYIRPYQKK